VKINLNWSISMSKITMIFLIVLGIAFGACAKTPQDNYYNRATNSSEQAIQSLDHE
jgi:ABC-type dipeptide/oligopeptide/nickel transport system permease component